MTNREKYAKEILDIACKGEKIAVNKSGNVVSCDSIAKCSNCIFYKGGACNAKYLIREWREAEYVEKPKISERDRRFLDYISIKYKWMAMDKDGSLYIYERNRPWKCKNGWQNGLDKYMWLNKALNISFPMVKWEDSEPWSIEDLKKLEVENE